MIMGSSVAFAAFDRPLRRPVSLQRGQVRSSGDKCVPAGTSEGRGGVFLAGPIDVASFRNPGRRGAVRQTRIYETGPSPGGDPPLMYVHRPRAVCIARSSALIG